MRIALFAFAVYMVGAGILLLFEPKVMRKLVKSWMRGKKPNRLMALSPLIIGWLLLWAAPASEVTVYVKVLGWLALLKGVYFLLLPAKSITGVITWWLDLPAGAYVMWGFIAVAAGLPILVTL